MKVHVDGERKNRVSDAATSLALLKMAAGEVGRLEMDKGGSGTGVVCTV